MKLVFRTVVFHFLCILIFGLLYWRYTSHFIRDIGLSANHKILTPSLIDHLFLSTTIQAGVGYSDLYPITTITKSLMILQQFIMISTHVFIIYIFTL